MITCSAIINAKWKSTTRIIMLKKQNFTLSIMQAKSCPLFRVCRCSSHVYSSYAGTENWIKYKYRHLLFSFCPLQFCQFPFCDMCHLYFIDFLSNFILFGLHSSMFEFCYFTSCYLAALPFSSFLLFFVFFI